MSGDNVYGLTGDVYLDGGAPGTAVDENSYAMATYIYTAGSGPDTQLNADQVEADIADADGVNPAYYQYDVGSGWDWEPCAAGVQDVMVVMETVWGMNGWTGANYTTSSNTTLSCALFDVLPDSQIRMIPTPTLNMMGTDWANLTWTGLLEDTPVGPNIASYDVQRAPAIDGPYASIGTSTAQVPGGSVYYNDTGPLSGTYYYRIAVNYARGLAGYTTMGLSDFLMVSMDIIPPAAVTISPGTITSTSVQLNWTAPGDDGNTGTASVYDVRYSAGNCAAFVWATATQATGEPAPQIAGSLESFTVPGLAPSTLYAFAQMTGDEVPNWSPMSNCLEATTQTPDVTPPAASTIATGTITTTSVELTWMAPGDDGNTGTATTYDVRYSAGNCAAFVWATATQATGEPAPQAAGSAESFTVPGLASGTLYAFAQMTADEVPNWSPMSNCVEATTLTPDVTPPAASIIAAGTITTTSVELTWNAPGDDGNTGTASEYDVRYSAGNCAAFVWATATQATGEPAPQVAGSAESFTVTGLTDSTLYAFAQMTADEVPNWSPMSNCVEATTATPDTTAPSISGLSTSPTTPDTFDDVTITVTVTDADAVTVKIIVKDPDGSTISSANNVTMSAGTGANEYEFVLSSLYISDAGTYAITIWANDSSGNYNSASGTFDVTTAVMNYVVAFAVIDKDIKPISDADVVIKDSAGTEVAKGKTTNGVYNTTLPGGSYTVTVSKSGYKTVSKDFSLTGVIPFYTDTITLEEEGDLTWLWIIIIIIIILIVILLIWLLTRKKPAEEPKPEEAAEAEEMPAEGEAEGEGTAAAAAAPAAAATTKTCVSCGREIKVEFDLCPFCGAHQTETAPAAEEIAEEPKAEEAEVEKAAEEPEEEPKAAEEKKVNCKNCGKEILPGFAICPYCGTSQ